MIIFDPLSHVKPYSNSMFSAMKMIGIKVFLVQKRYLSKNKVVRLFYYYSMLFYQLYVIRERIIFNIPLLPILDLILLSMSARNDHILVVHNSVFGHSYARLRQYFYEEYIKRFRYFIAHSRVTQDFINTTKSGCKSDYHILTYSIPFNEVESEMSALEKEITVSDKYFLFCGSIKPYKGVDILLDAIKHNYQLNSKRFKLIVAGKFVKETRYLKDEFLSLDSEIEIFDWQLSDEFMNLLIKNSSCVILPYRNIDNSGIFAQAKYFDVPVISSDIGVFREENLDDVFGRIFLNGNVDMLSLILQDLWYDQGKLSSIAKNCAERELLSWEGAAEQICGFIEK